MAEDTHRGVLIAVLIAVFIAAALFWPLGMMGMYGARPFALTGAGLGGRLRFPLFWFGVSRLVLLAVMVGIVVVLLRGRNGASVPPSPETPLDILKRRYATGEISREQFDQMRKDLGV